MIQTKLRPKSRLSIGTAMAISIGIGLFAPKTASAQSAVVYRENKAFATALAAYERREFQIAFENWLPLARQDDPAAQRNIGHLYRNGLGVAQDFAEAMKWYRKAAELGLPGAQANLADMLERGQGLDTPNPVEAAKWFQTAGLQGHVVARFRLARMLAKGNGVAANPKAAIRWYEAAAEGGHPTAGRIAAELRRNLAE